ncbi:MAG: 2-hydroxyacyl-CoA dehydratase [Deltaproteobacteria bacterium]|nr:2-hydroxyacyl-CoA dehydratase [Deltaproteobacteria bacterium]
MDIQSNNGVLRDRKAYIKAQKAASGRTVLGVFPAHYPKEILWALNILPVEIWDPPVETTRAGAHLQPYTCGIVKSGLALILEKKWQHVDGFLFPHTCDSIQNLASMVNDYLTQDTPCFFFYHPKAPYRESSRRYYRNQLHRFLSDLESHFGPLDTQNLKHAIHQSREINNLLKKIYALRAASMLKASNHTFYDVVRLGEYLHPDDYIPLLRQFISRSKGTSNASGLPILLSGILPAPRGMLSLLDQLSVNVVNDDYLCCQRRIAVQYSDTQDLFDAMAASYFAMPPCSTKGSPIADRLDYILRLAETGRAKGILFNPLKFCEPEHFDIPQLVHGVKKAGLAALIIESDIDPGASGQLATRIEAFVEMLH